MRTPLIAGNWKLNKTIAETRAYIQEFAPLVQDARAEALICPVFTALNAASEAAQNTNIRIGAQDCYWKDSGAYTGEVSLPLLQEAGVTHVLLGHSERRGRFGVPEPDLEGAAGHVFGDTDQSVHKKLHAVLAAGLTPIICCGETLTERKNGHTDTVVANQIAMALEGVSPDDAAKLVFAYEPVWAIGTGEVCDAPEANRVCGVVRQAAASALGGNAADVVRVQYGGSVKPDNARELLGQEHIDGALVGGASLKPSDFAAIVNAAG
jgi:triosephosphate isomerase